MQNQLKNKKSFYFCGIGGIGMSGLAKIMIEAGHRVFGSDSNKSSITTSLEDIGAKIYYSQDGSNIKNYDFFIYSAAIPKSNEEYIEAKKRGVKMLSRSELLGLLMKEKKGIAVSGTHGKTTTSTMLSLVLDDAGLSPTIVVGGEVGNIGGSAKSGKGDYFVAEACEYEKAFLDIYPFGAIITNIEADHLDTYKGIDDIIKTFKVFANQIESSGFLVLCADDKNTMSLKKSYTGNLITYGFRDANYIAENVKILEMKTGFDVKKDGNFIGSFELLIPGSHNVLNALSVIATADYLGVATHSIKKTLANFTNAKRRYDIKGKKNNILVIDDYAHHPTEIKATLAGIVDFYPMRRVWAVFQPHQFSRTKLLFEDFSRSFFGAYRVIIPDIYEARDTEADKASVSSRKLTEAINKNSKNAKYISNFHDVAQYLEKNAEAGDIVITLGAGPVYRVGEEFLGLDRSS